MAMAQHRRRGRPVRGAKLLDRLAGSEHAKRRLRLMLQTLAGEITVEQACAELDLCPAAFFKLRTRTLQEMLAGLEPRQVGRPAEQVSPEQQRIEELTAQIGQLEIQLQAARVREELALAGLVGNKRPVRQDASSKGATSIPDIPREPVGSAPAQPGAGPAGTPDLKKTNQPPTG
jgi:hypothetical protein